MNALMDEFVIVNAQSATVMFCALELREPRTDFIFSDSVQGFQVFLTSEYVSSVMFCILR